MLIADNKWRDENFQKLKDTVEKQEKTIQDLEAELVETRSELEAKLADTKNDLEVQLAETKDNLTNTTNDLQRVRPIIQYFLAPSADRLYIDRLINHTNTPPHTPRSCTSEGPHQVQVQNMARAPRGPWYTTVGGFDKPAARRCPTPSLVKCHQVHVCL